MNDREVQRDAALRIHTLIAQAEMEDVEEAANWVVTVSEAETNTFSVHGPFLDPVSAMAFAERFEHELNSGIGENEIPYVTAVYPVIRHLDPRCGA
jgi:hypothetical protein